MNLFFISFSIFPKCCFNRLASNSIYECCKIYLNYPSLGVYWGSAYIFTMRSSTTMNILIAKILTHQSLIPLSGFLEEFLDQIEFTFLIFWVYLTIKLIWNVVWIYTPGRKINIPQFYKHWLKYAFDWQQICYGFELCFLLLWVKLNIKEQKMDICILCEFTDCVLWLICLKMYKL